MKIEPLDRVAIANIDFPFEQKNDFTPDGLNTTSFAHIKRIVDKAKSVGFDAIAIDTNVPINIQTGELQLLTPEGHSNRDKSFSPEIWKIIQYAESLGMKTIIDLHIRDAVTDNDIWEWRIGNNFDIQKFFQKVKNYEVEIAKKAQTYGVDSITIGMNNFGFSDSLKYKTNWVDITSAIRSVYSGQLGYQDIFSNATKNIVFELVDNIIISFQPNLSPSKIYDAEKIVPLYFNSVDRIDTHQNILNIIDKNAGKKIFLEISPEPGQPGIGNFVDIRSSVFGENSGATLPGFYDFRIFPSDKIDYLSLQAQLKAFLEYLGNYLEDKVSGFEYNQYAPWTDAAWFRNPSNVADTAYNAMIRAVGVLNYTPQAEEVISQYISRNWGFTTLHYGTDKADQLTGSEVDDKFFSSTANDVMNGGLGKDTVKYTGNLTSYTVNRTANSVSVDKPNSGRDVLTNIERLVFDDRAVAFDTDGTAGRGYRIYKAAFDRTPDTGGLGYWIKQMDQGMDMVEVAARFIDSAEFRTLYGQNPSNADFLSKVYNNVLDRNPDADGLAWWVNEMKTNPAKTWQKVLADFAESTENQANVASVIATGIAFDVWS